MDNVLFDSGDHPLPQDEISEEIVAFGDKYNKATEYIIQHSQKLDRNGDKFIQCSARILSSFGMTRSGPFQGLKITKNGRVNDTTVLRSCWDVIGEDLLKINYAVNYAVRSSGLSRDRYLLEISESEREKLIAEIWRINKSLLPFTMSSMTYGLVGASKILFAVLPEIVLPIDNSQWKNVFKTVDLGDVIRQMASEIQRWEEATGMKLNELDESGRLTTLPSVYNVMAMAARPKG